VLQEAVLGNDGKQEQRTVYLRLPTHASECDAEQDADSNCTNDLHIGGLNVRQSLMFLFALIFSV